MICASLAQQSGILNKNLITKRRRLKRLLLNANHILLFAVCDYLIKPGEEKIVRNGQSERGNRGTRRRTRVRREANFVRSKKH